MTNFLVSIIIAIGLVSLTGWGAMELFQGARDSYDMQMLSLRLEQVGAAVKSNIRVIDGLPALPASINYASGSYPMLPTWISANAIDTNGHPFVYCPYALRPTSNLEGTSYTGTTGTPNTTTGLQYNIVGYSSSLFGTNSPNYVVGSDKPTLYSSAASPSGTLTPSATTGYGKTFTASSAVFSASNIGQQLQSGAGTAIITGYTSPTQVVATITQAFPSTSAIASGSWKITSVAPKGLLGFIIAFKPHDTYSASTAASWCNGQIQITESGSYTTAGSSVNGLVYPIVVGQSMYQQAYAKSDNVTYYAAPTATGDGTGRNTSNYATLQAIMAQLAALRPARAYVYLAAGTHSVTIKNYDQAYEPNNFRGLTVTLDGGTNSPTISLTSYVGSGTTNSTFNWPVNLILKNLTLSRADTTTTIQPSTDIKWVFDGVTDNVPTYVYNNLWVRSTSNTSAFNNILQIAKNGKLYINGTTNVTAHAGYFQLVSGELNILPGNTLTYAATSNQWDNGYNNPVLTVGTGSTLNVGQGATLSLTTSGVQMNAALGVEAGGTINMNGGNTSNAATLSIGSGSGTVAGATGRSVKGAIFVSGEMNINKSSILFPNGVATGVAAVDLVDGGKFTMHNGSAIGSSSTTAQRPYYGVYDDGGTFVGGSSTGYSTGANGEGGSPQSNVYVQNSAGAMCWSGYPWPTSPASGSSAQQRHLFWDSPEGNGTTSAPRGTNINTFSTSLTATSPTIATGTQSFTIPSGLTIATGAQVSIVSNTNVANYMSGYVTQYYTNPYAAVSQLTVNVTAIGGSGTIASGGTVAGGMDMRHLIFANQTNWACTNPTTTTSPAAFTFAAPPVWCSGPSPYISETILPTGYNSSATISISGTGTPKYSLDGGTTWTNSTGTISPGQTLTLEITPPSTNSGTVTATVTIGSTSTTWSMSTSSSCYGNPISGNSVTASASSTNSITATLNTPTRAGDLLVVTVASKGGALTYFCNNVFSVCGGWNNALYGSDPTIQTAIIANVPAGTTSITANLHSGNFTNAVMILTEYPDNGNAAYDQGNINLNSTTASATPTQASELIVGFSASLATSGVPTVAAVSPTSHFISVSSGPLTLGQADNVISSISAQTVTFTDTGTGVTNETGIDTIKYP